MNALQIEVGSPLELEADVLHSLDHPPHKPEMPGLIKIKSGHPTYTQPSGIGNIFGEDVVDCSGLDYPNPATPAGTTIEPLNRLETNMVDYDDLDNIDFMNDCSNR